ncbi:MAG: DUF4190 domain-containing protein [Desulfomonile sp.]|nr:DUF4190 domain-containing protein [Desulfomonile sp.]
MLNTDYHSTEFDSPGPSPRRPPRHVQHVRPCRADLVLVLGILSLFLCGPLGIAAWVLANSELRQMRAGLVSCERVRALKVGRVLGIIGAALFVVSVGVLVKILPGLLPEMSDTIHPEPLTADQIVFAGKWHGDKGSLIRIYPDGRGDFQTSSSKLTGGRVRIHDSELSIGLMGLYKTWHIKRTPYLENGVWKMRLNGETFSRETEGLLVMNDTQLGA